MRPEEAQPEQLPSCEECGAPGDVRCGCTGER